MKTAEDWWVEGRSESRSEAEVKKLLKAIQIDALREAAEIAAGKQNFEVDHPCKGAWNGCAQGIRDAIISRIKEIES